MSTNDGFKYDGVGVEHLAYGGHEIDRVVTVEPPKPTPRWLLRLQAIARRAGTRVHRRSKPEQFSMLGAAVRCYRPARSYGKRA
jgi:hypothetical protein